MLNENEKKLLQDELEGKGEKQVREGLSYGGIVRI